MAKQWHIDNASALIVDGVRFTLQTISWRNEPGDSISTARLWVKADDQSGPGFNIGAPLYLPNDFWTHYDNYGNQTQDWGIVFKERTWMYYGTAGYTPGGTQIPITTLSPHTTVEAPGRVLAFSGLRAFPGASAPNLYFDSSPAYIGGGYLAIVGVATRFQFYGLAA